MLVNPFIIYILSFSLVLIVYGLGWSNLVPSLTGELLFFMLITMIISMVFAQLIRRTVVNNLECHSRDKYENSVGARNKIIFSTLFILLCAEFIYSGHVPLLEKTRSDFGIPVIHVLYVTAATVFSTVFYDFYLQSKNKWFLFYSLLLITSFLLMFSRGITLIAITQLIIVYLVRRGFDLKKLTILFLLSFLLLFMFGWLGNLRDDSVDIDLVDITSSYIMVVGDATEEFRESNIIPKEFFWGYLYLVTPLANFQNSINKFDCDGCISIDSFAQYVANELIPDFLSKRINLFYGMNKGKNIQISHAFNVGTLYGPSYVYLGWIGVFITYVVFSIIIFLYFTLSQYCSETIITIAVVGSFVLFCVFANMISFSGMSLQLIWALVAHRIYRVKMP